MKHKWTLVIAIECEADDFEYAEEALQATCFQLNSEIPRPGPKRLAVTVTSVTREET